MKAPRKATREENDKTGEFDCLLRVLVTQARKERRVLWGKKDVSFILTGLTEEKNALHVQQVPLNGCVRRMGRNEREMRGREGGRDRESKRQEGERGWR